MPVLGASVGSGAEPRPETKFVQKTKNLKTQNNKAAGLDEVTAELLKHGRDTVASKLTDLFNRIWRAEEVPED